MSKAQGEGTLYKRQIQIYICEVTTNDALAFIVYVHAQKDSAPAAFNRVQQNASTAHMLLEKCQAPFCIKHLGISPAAHVL